MPRKNNNKNSVNIAGIEINAKYLFWGGIITAIIAGVFLWLSTISPIIIQISATQTAEARLTQVAVTNQVTKTPLSTFPTETPGATLVPGNPSTNQPTTHTYLSPGEDLKNNCISADLWTPYHGEAHLVDDRNCWNLTDWNFASQDGGLLTFISTENFTKENAIYASLSSETARIDFELHIDILTGASKAYPAVVEFGITPEMVVASYYGQSLPGQNLFISGGSSKSDYFYSIGQTYADPKKALIQFPADSLDHHITLVLDVSTVTFYFDGTQIAETGYTSPSGNRYFRIGYEEPAYSTIKTFIHDLTVKQQP